jgi:hypothetical protein
MRQVTSKSAIALLTDAVWRGKAPDATKSDLDAALVLARRNQVEGWLARAYPQRLPNVLTEVRLANDLFADRLHQVTSRLGQAGIPGVLIKLSAANGCVREDFDLVVRERQWDGVFAALDGWYACRTRYWLERATKSHLCPPDGPALHLHASVSWFGVPVIPTEQLFARASGSDLGFLIPAPADRLRIWLGHAQFQNLSLDLSELIAVRDLLRPGIVREARREASLEGWRTGFDHALATAAAAISRLDRGLPVTLPVPLRTSVSMKAGAEHVAGLYRAGQARAAAREAALRVPLVIAKKTRMLAS